MRCLCGRGSRRCCCLCGRPSYFLNYSAWGAAHTETIFLEGILQSVSDEIAHGTRVAVDYHRNKILF